VDRATVIIKEEFTGRLLLFFGTILGSIVFWVDYTTLGQYSIYLFYFPFIMTLAWYRGRSAGFLAVLLCSLAWFFTRMNSDTVSSHAVLWWHSWVRLVTFSFVAWIGVHLKAKYESLGVLEERLAGLLETEKRLSREDSLTGAFNWRAFDEKLNDERKRSSRNGHGTALLYFDVDNFKGLNDSFGHAFGDDVLKKVVLTIRSMMRGVDVVARLGGDEFAVLMPETSEGGAKSAAERIDESIKKNLQSMVSVSIGVAAFAQFPESNELMVQIADSDMYRIKKARQTRVTITD